MSKRRKSSSKRKKSSKCPEPFNTMIDFAGGLTMTAIASSKEKKYHYSERGKVNPYAVSAIGIGTGKMNTTDDVIRTGAMLGAMGAFDDDNSDNDPLFSFDNYDRQNDNRYAWRLNCEDGSDYGIDPEDFETRDEYNEALHAAKCAWEDVQEDDNDVDIDSYETDQSDEDFDNSNEEGLKDKAVAENENIPPEEDYDDFHVFVYCKIKLPEADEPVYYRSEDHSLRTRDRVIVPSIDGKGIEIGEILSVELHMSFSVPQPIEETQMIIGRYTS